MSGCHRKPGRSWQIPLITWHATSRPCGQTDSEVPLWNPTERSTPSCLQRSDWSTKSLRDRCHTRSDTMWCVCVRVFLRMWCFVCVCGCAHVRGLFCVSVSVGARAWGVFWVCVCVRACGLFCVCVHMCARIWSAVCVLCTWVCMLVYVLWAYGPNLLPQ